MGIKPRLLTLKISDFTKNILFIMTGSSVSQVINIVSIPILTRLFLKDDIGAYQVILSFVMTVSTVASLKYESAIVLPESEAEANEVTSLSLITLSVFTILLGVVFWVFNDAVFGSLNIIQAKPFAVLVVALVFLKGVQVIIQQLTLRSKRFKEYSHGTVIENTITKGGTALYGLISPSLLTMLAFNSLGTISSIAYLLNVVKSKWKKIRFKNTWSAAKTYKKFPFVNTPMFFLNELSLQLPVFFLSRYFGLEIVALYAMGNRIITMPMSIISSSISRVYYQKAAELFNRDRGELKRLFLKTLTRLILIGVAVIILIYVFSPVLVNVLLGSEWERAIDFIKIMAPLLIFRFACNSLSSTFTVVNRQEYGLILTVFSLILRAVSMILFSSTPESMIWALSISSALFYLLYALGMYRSIVKSILIHSFGSK